MGLAEIIDSLPELREEARRARQEANEAAARAAHLEQVVAGLEGLICEGVQATAETELAPGSGLRGTAAVRQVIREEPDRLWRAREILEVLERRGWTSPQQADQMKGVEAVLHRLMKTGEIDRIAAGQYRLGR